MVSPIWLISVVALLGGCATDGMIVHRLPPQTPTYESVLIEKSGAEPGTPMTAAESPSIRSYDPWQRFNRFNYRFNARLDESVLFPISNAYQRLPSPLRTGVHQFFENLAEINSTFNYMLQGRVRQAAHSIGRFAINTTLGIGGVLDVATKVHLAAAPTGFQTTLAIWGMHPGPYLVIPVVGPSTLRDLFGMIGNFGFSYGVNLANLYRGDAAWALGATTVIDQRSNVSFRYYSTGSPLEYDNVRFLYVHKLLIEDEGLHKNKPTDTHSPTLPAGK